MTKKLMNQGWQFVKSDIDLNDLNTAAFEPVFIPHTWNNIDGQDGGNDYVRCVSTYVNTFDHEKTDEIVYLTFEGVNSVSTVYLNGHKLGRHEGGYSTFRYDITGVLNEKGNVLVVYADNRHDEAVYPLAADFTFYGGIYRPVYLEYRAPIHFDMEHVGAQGVYVSQKNITKEKAIFDVTSYVTNKTDQSEDVSVMVRLKDDQGHVLIEDVMTKTIEQKTHMVQTLTIDHPHLWHSIKDPYLYEIEVELVVEGSVIDKRLIPTGFRFFSFDHESFYLNGEKMTLNGVSRHQDRIGVGNALTHEMHDEDFQLIKELGANSVRLAHYQQSAYVYDLCDRLGFVVWAEIPYISMSSKTDLTGKNALSQMEELIKQNYNHASIVMWGISNEITIAGKKNNVDEILVKLNKLAKSMDPYRVTTMAQVSMLPLDDVQNTISDVIGYNHYFGWYGGKVEDFSGWLAEYRKVQPSKPLCLSEYGVEGIHTLHSEDPKVKDYSEEYHALWHEKAYDILANTPYVWGTYIWNMFAFAADFRDEGGSKGMNNKGLVTFDRKIKKDAFYFYQARWTEEPMLHLTQKRFKERAQDVISIKAYSNLDHVDFYVNEKHYPGQEIRKNVFVADVPLNKGENRVVAKTGNLTDETVFIRVEKKNPSYEVPADDKNKGVFNFSIPNNWFDNISEETHVMEIDSNYLSVKDSLETILKHPEGNKLIKQFFEPLLNHPFFEMMSQMSIEQLRNMSKENFAYGPYVRINEALQKIKK